MFTLLYVDFYILTYISIMCEPVCLESLEYLLFEYLLLTIRIVCKRLQ